MVLLSSQALSVESSGEIGTFGMIAPAAFSQLLAVLQIGALREDWLLIGFQAGGASAKGTSWTNFQGKLHYSM